MDRFKADIVAINETLLSSEKMACAPAPPGYRLRCTPRPQSMRGGCGGGVRFYIRDNIRVKYLKDTDATIEQMWISTRVNGCSLVIGTAYRPEWVNVDLFLDAITDSVSKFSHFDYVVLLGDFNIDRLKVSDRKTVLFNQFLRYVDLQQVVTEITHTTDKSESVIDIVCTNSNVRHVEVTDITGTIGLRMVNVTLALKKTKEQPKTFSCR